MDIIDIGSRNLVVEELVSFLALVFLLKNKLDRCLPASSVSLIISNPCCCFNDELFLALLQSITIYIAISAAFMAAIIDFVQHSQRTHTSRLIWRGPDDGKQSPDERQKMDFDIAANRLQRDQQNALAKSRASRTARETSSKVRQEAALAKAETEHRIHLRKRLEILDGKVVDATWSMIRGVENELGIMNVGSEKFTTAKTTTPSSSSLVDSKTKSSLSPPMMMASGWSYFAKSIYGDGDKITLPPSTLAILTDSIGGSKSSSSRPIAFRIGIINPKYSSFPASATMRVLLEDMKQRIIATTEDEDEEDDDINGSSIDGGGDMIIDDEIDDNGNDNAEFISRITKAYLDELSHRYLSYTHGTVVEFTQDENHVGLPVSIAKALLQPNIHSLANRSRRMSTRTSDGTQSSNDVEEEGEDIIIPSTRTIDPASLVKNDRNGDIGKTDNDYNDSMNVVESVMAAGTTSNDMTEKTPGHPAYNQFDIPSVPIEIIPLTTLLPGKNITFTPTPTSIQNGFYNIKDIKMVLEQSLVRSRATLSLGDVVRTWKRGISYDLIVSDLNPRGYGVVSCVDTDVNVEFGSPDMIDNQKDEVGAASKMAEEVKDNGRGGNNNAIPTMTKMRELIPEPPMDIKLGICNIQIRGRTLSGTDATGRRRFDVTSAKLADLFDFASNVCGGIEPTTFRLVTRFPRRVFTLNVGDDAKLESVEITPGQEMFMVESI